MPIPLGVMVVAIPSPAFLTCLVVLRDLWYPCNILGEKTLCESEVPCPITVTEWPWPASRSPCLQFPNVIKSRIIYSRYDVITLEGLSSSVSRALKSNDRIRSTDSVFWRVVGKENWTSIQHQSAPFVFYRYKCFPFPKSASHQRHLWRLKYKSTHVSPKLGSISPSLSRVRCTFLPERRLGERRGAWAPFPNCGW